MSISYIIIYGVSVPRIKDALLMSTQHGRFPSLTTRSIILGIIGSIILSASSLFIALKMGALPWPIVFAVLVSSLSLRALGSKDIHEVNVTHAAMSAGAMVAGGLAFTIPALWISNPEQTISIQEVLFVAIAGTTLGLIACATFQAYFIRKKKLTYPIGISAADTLKATQDNSGKSGKALFGGMGFAALWAGLRDIFGWMPQVFIAPHIFPGIGFGVFNSPMICSLGFIIGTTMAFVWFAGALIGNIAIGWAAPTLGWIDFDTANNIRMSLGLGVMLGVGAGVIISNLLTYLPSKTGSKIQEDPKKDPRAIYCKKSYVAIICALVAFAISLYLNMTPIASITFIAATWFCIWLAAYLTGTTGINPMEIFGVVVLLLIQLLFSHTETKTLFLLAGIVAVGCGICGDVMCDLKAGDVLKTNPYSQFAGMVVGGYAGAICASVLLVVLFEVYGAKSFGFDAQFVSAQASVVATMAGGIPHQPAFITGIIAGVVLSLLKLPVMTLGLGIYLPFYISSGAFVGAVIKLICDRAYSKKPQDDQEQLQERDQAIASGILGGESLIGILVAILALISFK